MDVTGAMSHPICSCACTLYMYIALFSESGCLDLFIVSLAVSSVLDVHTSLCVTQLQE